MMHGRGVRARGFSMIELLIVVVIGAIIGMAVISIMLSQMQLTSTQNRNIINQQELRSTLQFMADEIQLMGQGVVEPYVYQATAISFSFVGDLDGNTDPDLVVYTVVDHALHRTYSTSADGGLSWTQLGEDDLLENVESMSFDYYAEGNTTPGNISQISSVAIKLTLDPAVGGTAITAGRVRRQSMVQRITIRNRLFD